MALHCSKIWAGRKTLGELMKAAFFSHHHFEKPFLAAANRAHNHNLEYFDIKLSEKTASLAANFPAISCFVTDQLNAEVLQIIVKNGTRLVALRSAGFNHVDLVAAKKFGLTVVRVPNYSPYAVAEFAVGLILALNRKIPQACAHVREHNFSLEGLLGFDLHGRTIGIVGTGKIGTIFGKIMQGFGCEILAHDPIPNEVCQSMGVKYVSMHELCQNADIISLHCPLTPDTHHLINDAMLVQMKPGVMLINTGRGALIDTKAVIQALKQKTIGYLGIDVYEEEENLFFQDLSDVIIQDDVFGRLQTFPNVIITGHQAFFTQEALKNIAEITLASISLFEKKSSALNEVRVC
jgi:D-lactate dehydrogenase